jgi:phosphohistidine phosphatase SixA
MNMNNNNKILKIFGILIISIILFSSLVSLYKDRNKINFWIINKNPFSDYDNKKYLNKEDIFWSKKIMEGGYILHFRHAERDKWIDVQIYDSLESDVHNNGKNGTRFAENDYFSKAVCLNDRGLVQARAIGEHLSNIKFPIGFVISSPSCRSRQTANLSFGGYDELNRILVHAGPYNENKKKRISKLKKLYMNLPIHSGTNTIVSAHNNVVHSDMFENMNNKDISLEEGGFYIISKKNGKLYLEHEFHYFKKFIKNFYER